MQLTLVGEWQLDNDVFESAQQHAKAHVRSNYVKGITAVTDMPSSTKKAKKDMHVQQQQQQQQQLEQKQLQAMEFAAGRLINKDG